MSEQKRLVLLFARLKHVQRLGAPLRVEERYHGAFTKHLGRMNAKYPDVDLSSDRFYQNLTSFAETEMQKFLPFGPGHYW